MDLTIKDDRLKLLLERKKQFIGKRVTWDTITTAASFIISVLGASYPSIGPVSGAAIKFVFLVIGICFAAKTVYDIAQSKNNNYTFEDLLEDITALDEVTHHHSIVVVKDSFNEYPNRILVYDDERWGCPLFLNYKQNTNNEPFIKGHLSSELKVAESDIRLTYKTSRLHEKYSPTAKARKLYCHYFYLAEIANFPTAAHEDSFELDGRRYHWVTIPELEQNPTAMEKNADVIEFVKEIF